MRVDQFGHLKHRYLIFVENRAEFVVGQNVPLVGWVLQIFLFDVIPDLFRDFSARQRPLGIGGHGHSKTASRSQSVVPHSGYRPANTSVVGASVSDDLKQPGQSRRTLNGVIRASE